MKTNHWYGVLQSSELKKNKPLGVKRLGEKLLFYRDKDGKPICLSDLCCHRKAALSLGKIKNHEIECPFHGLTFDSSGKCTHIPANGNNTKVPDSFRVKNYPCREHMGFIFIFYYDTTLPEVLPELQFFSDIDESFNFGTIRTHWKCYYTRAMENQLDVAHLPFVHRTTIGRGGATMVDGPGIEEINENQFNVYIYNKKDDGGTIKKPNEVEVPDTTKPFKLELILPNLWQNYLHSKARILGVFAPVDDENCVIYFRVAHKFSTIPIISHLITGVLYWYSNIIQKQDKRVVETQTPSKPIPQDEKFFQADKPIIMLRKWYDK